VSALTLAARPGWPMRAAAWAVAAALAVVAAQRVDLAGLGATLRGATWTLVGAAVLCNLTSNTLARVRRWAALLAPIPHRQRASFLDLTRLFYASVALNNLLPARAGEAIRVVQLHRHRGYPPGALIAAQLAEKAIEAVSLGLVCGALALLPGANRTPLLIAGGLATAAVTALSLIRGREPAAAGKFLQALRTLHAERSWIRSLGWALLADANDLLLVALCLRALGIDAPPSVWALVLLGINFAILLPSTPGQIGVLEAGAVLALSSAGIPAAPAAAFAVVYHAVHLVPSTALGLIAISLPWR
jgi:glycosyltransferase 2 family protein